MNRRVVITGMGVAAPNGVGLPAFTHALKNGISGIDFQHELERLEFRCQIAGKPEIPQELLEQYFSALELRGLNSSGIVYGVVAGVDAWRDAQLPAGPEVETNYDQGIIFGTGISGVDKFREAIHLIDAKNTRRLGSTSVVQTMTSGISAYLNSKLACGNQVTTNSSACTTGAEAVLMACERIRSGQAKRMLAGSCSDSGPYIWGGFDALRILPSQFNENPQAGSRPMSATAAGFVPGSGAGALVLEDLESALERGVKIYAEVLGGHINSGGQRHGGSMTAPNSDAVKKCIKNALFDAGVRPKEIDAINGHLTATAMDETEIANWCEALELSGKDFPVINSLKSLTGHCLSAAGSIECVASVLQVSENFIFGNKNVNDLHPAIEQLITRDNVPEKTLQQEVNVLAKASFGFGDVNSVVIFSKFNNVE